MGNKEISDILNNLAKAYQQKYGVAVFSIEAKKNANGGWNIRGFVLTENQKDEVLSLLKKAEIKVASENILILGNGKKRNEIGWGRIKVKIAHLKSRFVSNEILNDRILKRIRCSQASENEVVRILYKKEGQVLVQQNDLTLGWIDAGGVSIKKDNLYKKWNSGNLAEKNNLPKNNISKIDIVKEARKFIGTKYVLGGKSNDGIDCSGLAQIVYKNTANLILPKHSWDQKKVGTKIDLEDVEPGDLIFLVKKKNSHKHVGIVAIDDGKLNLIHASLDKKKVVMQGMDNVLEDYDFVEARKVVNGAFSQKKRGSYPLNSNKRS